MAVRSGEGAVGRERITRGKNTQQKKDEEEMRYKKRFKNI
jgi:hypothetical protein